MKTNIPTILLVDDEDEMLEMYAAKLKEADFETLAAHDGYEAIAMAKEEQPDLILLDIMMPGLSGTETLLKLKEDPTTTDIPVAFLSSLPETASEVATAKTAGAADFISKDIELDSFVQRVEKILGSTGSVA